MMEEYLKSNTQVREDILNQKLFFELKEASAKRNVHLKTFRTDVDIDGFDIIIDNNESNLLKCQVKSRFNATTPYFDIHKVMLKPSYHFYDSFCFIEPMGCPDDVRGIILIDAKIESQKISTQYYYLDIYLLRALELGVFSFNAQSKKMASELLKQLRDYTDYQNKRVRVIHSLFFPVKNVDALLSLMGFHSTFHHNFAYNILTISKILTGRSHENFNSIEEKISTIKGHWSTANKALQEIINETNTLKIGVFDDKYYK